MSVKAAEAWYNRGTMPRTDQELNTIELLIKLVGDLQRQWGAAPRNELVWRMVLAARTVETVNTYLSSAASYGHVEPQLTNWSSRRPREARRSVYFTRVGWGRYALSLLGEARYRSIVGWNDDATSPLLQPITGFGCIKCRGVRLGSSCLASHEEEQGYPDPCSCGWRWGWDEVLPGVRKDQLTLTPQQMADVMLVPASELELAAAQFKSSVAASGWEARVEHVVTLTPPPVTLTDVSSLPQVQPSNAPVPSQQLAAAVRSSGGGQVEDLVVERGDQGMSYEDTYYLTVEFPAAEVELESVLDVAGALGVELGCVTVSCGPRLRATYAVSCAGNEWWEEQRIEPERRPYPGMEWDAPGMAFTAGMF